MKVRSHPARGKGLFVMGTAREGNETFKDVAAAREWFAGSLFNLLVDYYPDIPWRPYGSGATPENVLPVLRELQPGFIIIYAKGHTGRTTFRSSLHTEHPMLAKDMPVFFREMTRKTGTKLFLYYSSLVDGLAGLRNPDWRMLDRDGKLQVMSESLLRYQVCPLSPYFEEWVSVHFRELFETADPDGIWLDGDWAGPCYCPRCAARFREESGYDGPMPEPGDLSTEAGVAWGRTWAGIKYEWWAKVSALIKDLNPTCLYSSGNVSPRKEFSTFFDWRSGDFFSPYYHRLRESIMCRRYTTGDVPYDAMTCDTSCCIEGMRPRTKTLPRMLQEGAGILANGGQWCYWTYPMPHGAFIPSKMRMAMKAREFARDRKDVCLHSESARWTAILDAQPTAALPGDNIWGAGKALIALHRSPDVMDETTLTEDVPYDLIVLPEQPVLGADMVSKLEQFVCKGGKLLSTGESANSPELQKLLGVKLVKRSALNDGHLLLQSSDPAAVFAPWDKLELLDAELLYPLYLSWDHFNPEMRFAGSSYPIDSLLDEEDPQEAGFPAATVRKLGKGLAVHVPTALFSTYWASGNPDMLAWVRDILDFLQPEPLFRTDAPSFVEVSLRRKGDTLLVHFVNGNPGRDLAYLGTKDLWVDDIPAVGPFTNWLHCAQKPTKVTWEPGGAPAEATWENGVLRFILPRLEIHTCLAVRR